MKMKKMLIVLAAVVSCGLFAQENLLKNGGFEQVSKRPKASDKYIMGNIKRGWDFGPGPVAKIPTHWVPNVNTGKVKLEIITVGADGKNKEHVVEGKNSLHITGKGFHLYNQVSLKPGKYRFSLKYKGSGRVTLCFYSYTRNAQGRIVHSGSRAPMTMMAAPQWKTYTKELEIGKWTPGTVHCTFALTGTNADVYIDDISVVAIPAGK